MRLDGDDGVALLHLAFDAGVRFVDTADVYGPDPEDVGRNERLVARALRDWRGPREQVVVATKGGLRREGNKWFPDGRARHIRAACEASLSALGVESIDLYQLHARDPRVPLPTTLRALARLLEEGLVRRVGLSNVSLEDLETASAILEIESVQVALSPLDPAPLKNGVLRHCAENDIALVAHSPLGGYRVPRRKLEQIASLASVARRHGASVPEVTLAWLLRLHPLVVPIPGATRPASVESILRAAKLSLTEEDLAVLEAELPGLRGPRPAERSDDEGEVVLFVGYPAAGKTTLARGWEERGYLRLNRDDRRGSLKALLPELDRCLARGERRIVLDNTYPRRASRFDVIDAASRHGVPVTCVWLRTSLEQAQRNAVERMIARYGRLLSPEEMKAAVREDPNSFPPDAQFRYRRELEPPRLDEGFQRIEETEMERASAPLRSARGLFFELDGVVRKTRSGSRRPVHPDDVEILAGGRDAIARFAREGFLLLAVSYQPGISEERVRACFERTRELLDLPLELRYCPHPEGPPICWCRKPLPGLGALFVEEHRLDRSSSLVVVASAADRGFAERLSIPTGELDALRLP